MKYSNTTNNPLVAEGQRLWKETLYRRDYSRAFALFSEAAAQGDADGINMVGMSYFHGRGVDKDNHKAADQGYMPAFWEMGNAYRDGLGVERNFGEAAAWFTRGVVQDGRPS